MQNEYTQFSAWFILSRGLKRVAAYEAEGWALVSVVPINMFGGTFAYNFVLRWGRSSQAENRSSARSDSN